MRTQSCPWCGCSVKEADRLWDHVVATGTCPHCHRFYDRAREAKVQRDVAARASDPAFSGVVRRARFRSLVEAVLCAAISAVIFIAALITHFPLLQIASVAALSAAGGHLLWALYLNKERHVRGIAVGKITAASEADRALLQAAQEGRTPDKKPGA